MLDVALVSCVSLPEPDLDAVPLARALAAAGVEARVLAWDDPGVDWTAARLAVLRSPWNYARQRTAFLQWVDRVTAKSRLLNPASVVHWNTHKSYMLDLEQRGLPITPTALVSRGSEISLSAILAERGWTQAVVKPAVSAGSFKTLRVDESSMARGESHLRQLAVERDLLVQQYLPSVNGHGERALVWIDGELTHAVRKGPRFTGDAQSVSPASVEFSRAEAQLARRALEMVDAPLLYARIDMAPGPRGEPVLMELELVEPSLYFDQGPLALQRFVDGIRRRL